MDFVIPTKQQELRLQFDYSYSINKKKKTTANRNQFIPASAVWENKLCEYAENALGKAYIKTVPV